MQAVILASGKGMRLRPLSLVIPKALAKVGGKTLLEHTVSTLPDEVDEIILVIGYLGEQIKELCGDEFLGRKIKYVEQKEQLGTGHALKICSPLLRNEKFFCLFSDDLFDSRALKKCLDYDLATVVQQHHNPSKFGVVLLRDDGSIEGMIEKPKNPPTNLVSIGPYLLNKNIFNYNAFPAKNGEYYLTEMTNSMMKDFNFYPVRANFWSPIASMADLKKAEEEWNKFLKQ